MKLYLWLLFVLSLVFYAACIQEFPVANSPCPCDEGYKCCGHITGENVCVKEGGSCPCSGVVGEMNVDPGNMPANGSEMAEVVVWVFAVCEQRLPLYDIEVILHSSRNQAGNELDFFEQPTGATDADGRVVAFVRSYTPGDAMLSATADGEALCKTWEEADCIEPLQMMITFDP